MKAKKIKSIFGQAKIQFTCCLLLFVVAFIVASFSSPKPFSLVAGFTTHIPFLAKPTIIPFPTFAPLRVSQQPTDTLPEQTYQQPQQEQQAVSYQNYGWYMHNGQSMQYVNDQWFSTPQQRINQNTQQTNQQGNLIVCQLSIGIYKLTPQQCSYYQNIDNTAQQEAALIKQEGQVIQQGGQVITNDAIHAMGVTPPPNFAAPTVSSPTYEPQVFTTPTTVCYDQYGQVIPNCH